MPPVLTPSRVQGLMILGLLILGAFFLGRSYVLTYSLILKDFDERSLLPFVESAEFLNLMGERSGVFTMHPDLLARYYTGPIYKLPEKGGFERILEEAKKKEVRYIIIESTCINSKELIDLYYYSVEPGWTKIPSEFRLVMAKEWKYGLYSIGAEEERQQMEFRAAVFGHLQWGHSVIWERMLAFMGASTSTYDDTTIISDVDFSKFDVVVFADFMRPLDDVERLRLEQSTEEGLIVIVSGLSPYYLAGGTTDLKTISAWFGASVFSDAPIEARWKVKFTEDAKEIMKEYLDLNQEYVFYTDSDWSTPTGCSPMVESTVYAYRVDDQTATIFSHTYGKGNIIFNGPRFGFVSQNVWTFISFLRALILSALE